MTTTVVERSPAFVNNCLFNVNRVLWPKKVSNEERNDQLPAEVTVGCGGRLRNDNTCVTDYAMQWNLLCQDGRRVDRFRNT